MERKTLLLDIAIICLLVIIGLFWFDVITLNLWLEILCFIGVCCGIVIFGSYFNHNYTKHSFLSQGRKHIKKIEWYDNEPNQEIETVEEKNIIKED